MLIEGNFIYRYLLHHDDIRDSILRLINYIFDYWTDDMARTISLPFCNSLIKVADQVICFLLRSSVILRLVIDMSFRFLC